MSDSRSDELLRFMLSASTSTSEDGVEYLSADLDGRCPGDGGVCLSGIASITLRESAVRGTLVRPCLWFCVSKLGLVANGVRRQDVPLGPPGPFALAGGLFVCLQDRALSFQVVFGS